MLTKWMIRNGPVFFSGPAVAKWWWRLWVRERRAFPQSSSPSLSLSLSLSNATHSDSFTFQVREGGFPIRLLNMGLLVFVSNLNLSFWGLQSSNNNLAKGQYFSLEGRRRNFPLCVWVWVIGCKFEPEGEREFACECDNRSKKGKFSVSLNECF